MTSRAMKLVTSAENYAKNRVKLAHEGETIADRVLTLADRVSKLDERVFTDISREDCMTRIWDAYSTVTDYLDSGAPYNLGSPEQPLYGEMLSDIAGIEAENADWDGCPGQVIVDNEYDGFEPAMS